MKTKRRHDIVDFLAKAGFVVEVERITSDRIYHDDPSDDYDNHPYWQVTLLRDDKKSREFDTTITRACRYALGKYLRGEFL